MLMTRHEDRNVEEPLVSRERVEEMLREIAMVLHMTRRVRDEMETEEDAEEYALV
jgi:hypothetical protein